MKRKTKSVIKWIATLIAIVLIVINNYQTNSTEQTDDYPPIENGSSSLLELPISNGKSGQLLQKTGFRISYNSQTKTPEWVAWELTKEETRGSAERSNEFSPDPDIKGVKVETYDYSHSGYDRGHMAPAGDMKWSEDAMLESFYMSNICPQDHNLNKGDWNDLEIKTREWARKYGKAYIACGPIYLEGKTIKRIGKRQVAVPHAFFKAILVYKKEKPLAMGFYFENKAGHKDLEDYLISIDELEQLTHLDFFSALPDDIEYKIEKETPDKLP